MLKEFSRFSFFLFLLFSAPGFSQSIDLGKTEFASILKAHREKKDYRFSHATSEINNDVLKLSDFTKGTIVPGTAFGGQANVVVDADIKDVNNYYLKKEAYGELHIPTFKEFNIKLVSGGADGASSISVLADLVIKVPVIKDIPVTDRITFTKSNTESILEWHQEDAESNLLWNRGCLIIEPMPSGRVLATVYAIHVLKPSEALNNWFAKRGASSFAVEHYTNFIKSFQNAASKKFILNNNKE